MVYRPISRSLTRTDGICAAPSRMSFRGLLCGLLRQAKCQGLKPTILASALAHAKHRSSFSTTWLAWVSSAQAAVVPPLATHDAGVLPYTPGTSSRLWCGARRGNTCSSAIFRTCATSLAPSVLVASQWSKENRSSSGGISPTRATVSPHSLP